MLFYREIFFSSTKKHFDVFEERSLNKFTDSIKKYTLIKPELFIFFFSIHDSI